MEDEAVEVQEGVVVGCWVLGVVGVGVVYEGLAEEARVTAWGGSYGGYGVSGS